MLFVAPDCGSVAVLSLRVVAKARAIAATLCHFVARHIRLWPIPLAPTGRRATMIKFRAFDPVAVAVIGVGVVILAALLLF